jgi:hypothetical protein
MGVPFPFMTKVRVGRRVGLAIALTAALGLGVTNAVALDDITPPSVTVVTPANNANYAQNSVVKANYSCNDASGIAACVGTVANGANIPTQALGTRSFTVSGYDNAGNKTKVTRTYNVVDQTPPVIQISKPTNGAAYPKNSAQFAQFACYDTGVGIASCVGTVSNGSNLPTGTVGAKQFKVTATDASGNVAVKVVNYQVV